MLNTKPSHRLRTDLEEIFLKIVIHKNSLPWSHVHGSVDKKSAIFYKTKMIASVRILTKKTENVYFVDQVTGFDAAIKKLKLNEKTKKETSFL